MVVSIVIAIGVILIAVLIGLDIWFAVDKIDYNTWSEIIRKWAKATPVIPWICGVLSGHFFWPMNWKSWLPLMERPGGIALMIWTGCVVGIIGLGLTKSNISFPLWLAFLIGAAGGLLLWPVGR